MDTTSAYWKLYHTQEQAFEAHRVAGPGTMVTAMDKTMDGRKVYAVTSLFSAYVNMMGPDIGRHQYELLMPLVRLRLYFDAEFSVPLNPRLDAEECRRALLHYIQRAYREIPNRRLDALPLEYVDIEESHREGVKVSYHGKVNWRAGIVPNMTAQRAFWARVKSLIDADIATGDQHALLLKVVSKRKLPNGPEELIDAYFWDGNVYTKHRLMRFLGACKWPKPNTAPSYLVPAGQTRASITFEQWRASLITASFVGIPDDVTVLDLPADWFALADAHWPTPVVTAALPTVKPVARTTDVAIQAYLANSFPADAVATMLTMNGLVALQYRHMSLSSVDGMYVHHFEHVTRHDLNRALHWRNAAAIHVGEATANAAPDGDATVPAALAQYTLHELCFDVDVTDYDADDAAAGTIAGTGVRWCACKDKKQLCNECWYMIEAAAAFLRDMLVRRMDIDEHHVLWVFSGSKGIHVWVNAAQCLHLTHEERVAIVQRYLNVDLEVALARDTLDPLIDALFVRRLVPHFERRAIGARALLAPAQAARLLGQWAAWIEPFAPDLAATWRTVRAETSVGAWALVKDANTAWRAKYAFRSTGNVPDPLLWIVAHYAWPRIDGKVTTERRHTLKAPFAVHAASRRVALPIPYPGEGRQEGVMDKLLVDENTAAHMGKIAEFQQGAKRLHDWCQWYNY